MERKRRMKRKKLKTLSRIVNMVKVVPLAIHSCRNLMYEVASKLFELKINYTLITSLIEYSIKTFCGKKLLC